MAITTTAEYKTHAGITNTDDDTYIGTLVTQAQELLEDEINYTLDGATRTEYYDGAGNNTITLKARPVVSVTSVTPVYGDGTLGTAWASTDYKIDLDTGILKLTPEVFGRFGGIDRVSFDQGADAYTYPQFSVSPQFGDQFRNVKVVYLAGWSSTPPYTAAPTKLKGDLWQIMDQLYLTQLVATGLRVPEDRLPVDELVKKIADARWRRFYP